MKKIILLIILVFAFIGIQAQKLQFHRDGTFKIAQFTDTHLDYNSKNTEGTIQIMKDVIAVEKPDFVVLTGDIVTNEPIKDGWLTISKPMVETKTPWTVTFGNHDEEMNMKKEEIFDFLEGIPYFIGQKDSISGVNNFTMPIYASTDDTLVKNVLYFFDSHDYTHNPMLGHYDWIKNDQINWYREQSDKFTSLNGGTIVPSMAFFHIPLREYEFLADASSKEGDDMEGVSASDINSGLFASMVEKKDVIGVFVGHDHDNNYIGIYKNIALGYGQATGLDAYGKLKRGGRVIVLNEGEFSFHTWIRTPNTHKYDFYYPSGVSEISDSTEVLKASDIAFDRQGIKYKYYEYTEEIKSADEVMNLPLIKEGIITKITIDSAKKDDYFAFSYTAWLKVPETAFYKFYTYSDDGSKLYIDGKLIIDNDGGHSAKREEGNVALEKGFHKFELRYFESYMGNNLEVGWSGMNFPEREISSNLYIE